MAILILVILCGAGKRRYCVSFCVNDSSGQVHCQGDYVLTLGEVAFYDAL